MSTRVQLDGVRKVPQNAAKTGSDPSFEELDYALFRFSSANGLRMRVRLLHENVWNSSKSHPTDENEPQDPGSLSSRK